ncbi:IS630 family transposase [Spirosoma pollinicola]|uniref:IS630 family transposase n=2 Tax=Spirosoma pollinicola TaxID=2057025 RepID=A0A2K8Z8E5_9BACT|nr:IS630 family transposase [Spirosoma pollinicola]
MENVLALYNQEPSPGRARLCFDERPCQLLDDVVAPLPVKPGKIAKEDNEYIRQGTGVVLLAYDLDKGVRYTQTRKQRTKAGYAQFMDHIVTTYYSHVEYIDLVQDNLNTHKYGSFYEHLPLAQARVLSRKLVFHYTLKHGSWLNIAEIEFSAMARQCLNRRIGSLDELGRQVELWTAERNERLVKVHWSFTVATAEDKLKRWYEQVNPANKPLESIN